MKRLELRQIIREEISNIMKESSKRRKFVLYTNPNNVTNKAYIADGPYDVNRVLKSARTYPDSYEILFTGMGNDEAIQKAKESFSNFEFV